MPENDEQAWKRSRKNKKLRALDRAKKTALWRKRGRLGGKKNRRFRESRERQLCLTLAHRGVSERGATTSFHKGGKRKFGEIGRPREKRRKGKEDFRHLLED